MSNKYNQKCLEKVAEIIKPYTEKLFGKKYDEKAWDEANNKVLDYFEETTDETELEFAEDWYATDGSLGMIDYAYQNIINK